jgi:hypothetical protein
MARISRQAKYADALRKISLCCSHYPILSSYGLCGKVGVVQPALAGVIPAGEDTAGVRHDFIRAFGLLAYLAS